MASPVEHKNGNKFLLDARRLVLIYLGLIDIIKEEVDQVNQYGQALPYKGEKTITKNSLEEFIQTIQQQGGISIEAVVGVHTNRKDKLIKDLNIGVDIFNYGISLKALLNNGRIVSFTQNFGRKCGSIDASVNPHNDTNALKTYITAGKTLIGIKTHFPKLRVRLSTSEPKFSLDQDTYHDLLRIAKKHRIKP